MIGGDLNTGTQWPAKHARWQKRDENLLQRFEAYGLVDCLKAVRPAGRAPGCVCVYGDDCTHTRTRRQPGKPDRPDQIDYLFASPAMAERLTTCVALAADEWFVRSDHAPIVAVFDLG